MRSPARICAAVWTSTTVAIPAAVLSGCERGPAVERMPSGIAFSIAEPPARPPVAYFEHACSGCHGPFGMFYGETFAAGRDDAALQKIVREMVEGPAQSTLDDRSLDALVAFHRALQHRAGGPFVALTELNEQELRGEVSPGAIVRVYFDDVPVSASADGYEWRVAFPPAWPNVRSVRVQAEIAATAAVTEIDAAVTSFSHAE